MNPKHPRRVFLRKTRDVALASGVVGAAHLTGCSDGGDDGSPNAADGGALDGGALDGGLSDGAAGPDGLSDDASAEQDIAADLDLTAPDGNDDGGADDGSDDGHADDAGPDPDSEQPDEDVASPDAGPTDGELTTFNEAFLPVDEAAFPLGVSSGAMTDSTALLWTRFAGPGVLGLKLWRPTESLGDVVMVYDGPVSPGDGGYTHYSAAGLLADAQYRFCFTVGGTKRSVVGSFRTAFAAGDTQPLKLVATTCTSGVFAPWGALSQMAEMDAHAFVHLGDMSYNDGAKTLADYRKEWQDTLGEAGYRDILSAHGMYLTWDDHEVDNNWDPETIDPLHLQAALTAFFETLPAPLGADGEPNAGRLWAKYTWGATAEIFVLDCRSERKPSTKDSDDPIYIGKEQMAWLKDGLSKSQAHFKILLNSVPMTDMPLWYLGSSDRWEGYQAQREELLDHIADNGIEHVVCLSGDFHIGFVANVDESGPGKGVREIAVGPGGNLNPAGLLPFPSNQFSFSHGWPQATTELVFDPTKGASGAIRVRFVRADNGDVLYDEELPG